VGSFLTLTRDEDSRSDVWSVEVLPSDSEPPDVQSDVRLQELESESGAAVSFAASRAEKPGLRPTTVALKNDSLQFGRADTWFWSVFPLQNIIG